MCMTKERLSPSIWIEAGLDQLSKLGPTALRAEPLSRSLKISKGSFYWHFKDVPAFQAAVLNAWKDQTLAILYEDAGKSGSSTDLLIRFGQSIQEDTVGPAIRAWAQVAPSVAEILAEVDEARIARLRTLMDRIGLRNDDFCKAAFGSLIGLQQTHLDDGDALVAYAALIDVILAST